MNKSTNTPKPLRSDWPVIVALIALSIVPFAAGIARLVDLASGSEITTENARFLRPLRRSYYTSSPPVYSTFWAHSNLPLNFAAATGFGIVTPGGS